MCGMHIIGGIIAIGAALVFAAIAGLTVWGGLLTLRSEVQRGFISVPSSPSGRLLTFLGVALPVGGVAVLSFLAAGRIIQVALGGG